MLAATLGRLSLLACDPGLGTCTEAPWLSSSLRHTLIAAGAGVRTLSISHLARIACRT